MKKILFIVLLYISVALAENFSNMSTQELIAIMGYVKPNNQKEFSKELRSRVSTMSSSEKKRYQQNLKKQKKNR